MTTRYSSIALFEVFEPYLRDKDNFLRLLDAQRKRLQLLPEGEDKNKLINEINQTEKILQELIDFPDQNISILNSERKTNLLHAINRISSSRARWVKLIGKNNSVLQQVFGHTQFILSFYIHVPLLGLLFGMTALTVRSVGYRINRRLLHEGNHLDGIHEYLRNSVTAQSLLFNDKDPPDKEPTFPFFNPVFDPGITVQDREKYLRWDIPGIYISGTLMSFSLVSSLVNGSIAQFLPQSMQLITAASATMMMSPALVITAAGISFWLQSRFRKIILRSYNEEIDRLMESEFANIDDDYLKNAPLELQGLLLKLSKTQSRKEQKKILLALSKNKAYVDSLACFVSLRREVAFSHLLIGASLFSTTASLTLSTLNILVFLGVLTLPAWLPYLPAFIVSVAVLATLSVASYKAYRALYKWRKSRVEAVAAKAVVQKEYEHLYETLLSKGRSEEATKVAYNFAKCKYLAAKDAYDRANHLSNWAAIISAALIVVTTTTVLAAIFVSTPLWAPVIASLISVVALSLFALSVKNSHIKKNTLSNKEKVLESLPAPKETTAKSPDLEHATTGPNERTHLLSPRPTHKERTTTLLAYLGFRDRSASDLGNTGGEDHPANAGDYGGASPGLDFFEQSSPGRGYGS